MDVLVVTERLEVVKTIDDGVYHNRQRSMRDVALVLFLCQDDLRITLFRLVRGTRSCGATAVHYPM